MGALYLTDFKLKQPDLRPKEPHAISVHIPWLNSGNVGDLTVKALVQYFNAEKLAEFKRPGDFYNFPLYRDRSRSYVDDEGNRHMEFPNSRVYYASRNEHDLLLLDLLEPTQFGERYVDRVVSLIKRLGVRRYVVAGSMGAGVPHTRPIMVIGRSSEPELTERLKQMGMRENFGGQYQGPTSILNTISIRLQQEGIATASLIANLPGYLGNFDNYRGAHSLLKFLSELEGFNIPLEPIEAIANNQSDEINRQMGTNPQFESMVRELELGYDTLINQGESGDQLALDVEKFLRRQQ